jgi:hypothetical protein
LGAGQREGSGDGDFLKLIFVEFHELMRTFVFGSGLVQWKPGSEMQRRSEKHKKGENSRFHDFEDGWIKAIIGGFG